MIELIFSALITILPDYLYRRHKQGKRLGIEITFYNFWYELRWGITCCVLLATTLLTVIFYYHPTATNVTSLFRTVSILSDRPGRVDAVYVSNNQRINAGDPIFSLDTARQQAAAETSHRRIAEVEATLLLAESELGVAQGNILSVSSALEQAEDELRRSQEIRRRNKSLVSERDIQALETAVQVIEGELAAAKAQEDVMRTRIYSLLPAQRASAEAALMQAETEIAKSTVFAGTDGTVKQFKLKPGDLVNPILRPAGILVPEGSGVGRFQAGFGQVAAQVVKPGMLMEITCASKPLVIIPMIVTEVQGAIAGGQLRRTDQLIDIRDRARPGTVMAVMEPLFEGHADAVLPGSTCLGVAYTSRAREIAAGAITGMRAFVTALVDGMGIANAFVLRIQAILLPVKVLVFPG